MIRSSRQKSCGPARRHLAATRLACRLGVTNDKTQGVCFRTHRDQIPVGRSPVEPDYRAVIQGPDRGGRIMRYELSNEEWIAIKPMLPNKPRGVPRVNDRRVLNGIFWVLRSGAPWRDLPHNFGPYTTCYNRFVRWRRAGVWAKIMSALAGAHDAAAPPSSVMNSRRLKSDMGACPPLCANEAVRLVRRGSRVSRSGRQVLGQHLKCS